jgi:hypothetical protein
VERRFNQILPFGSSLNCKFYAWPESLATFWERDRPGRIRRRPAGGTRASETFTLRVNS